MKLAHFDCFNGAAGDMIVAALLDAGADAGRLRERLDGLRVGGYSLAIEKVNKQGLAATRFQVALDESAARPHRHLKHIVEIVEHAELPRGVKDKATWIFTRLAEAEAAVHGTTVDKVHFHEVGAVDAIVDIVGAVVALDLLGIERVVCSPLPPGSGTVVCEHGVLPVPAPATAYLLRNVPLASSDEPGELVTPTGAAILTTLAAEFGPMPGMRMRAAGYGAGSREGRTRPNVLRVLIGDADDAGDTDSITVLETNLDDVTPQVVGHCVEKLLAAGALDVYTVPIQMKKQRPGVLLTVLCAAAKAAALERILFAETTTLGIRRHQAMRTKMLRQIDTVETPFGPIRMKIASRGDLVTAAPEYEDCKAAAERHGAALRTVMAAAQSAWLTGSPPPPLPTGD